MIASVFVLEACDDPYLRIDPVHGDNYGMVLLSAGGEQEIYAKASTSFLPDKVRFAAAMYQETDPDVYNFDTPTFTNMFVDGVTGNCVYRKPSYEEPTDYDEKYHNDLDVAFYWRNRKKHAFIGYIDNYNAALAGAENPSGTPYFPTFPQGEGDIQRKVVYNPKNPEDSTVYRYYTVDLTNPKDRIPEGTAWTNMKDQTDPLIAGTEQAPQASDPEKNRAYITFRHQFSHIRVNLKGHVSVGTLNASQIESVKLLGISEKADIYPFVAEHNGKKNEGSLITPAYGHPVDLRLYNDEQLRANQWGTSFDMFVSDQVDPGLGYAKSFDAIAYGTLEAIRIRWHELDVNGDPGVVHNVTFVVTDSNFKHLESGKRYIYNLELRRGTLAIVRTEIIPWSPHEKEYSGDGTFSYSHNGHGYPGHGGISH